MAKKEVESMIEIICKEEQAKEEKEIVLPKNVKQIGEVRGQQKIYVEDYVYTFLKKLSRRDEEEHAGAILLGEFHWTEGKNIWFVRSAVEIIVNQIDWEQVYEENRKYFQGQEIIGWFANVPGNGMRINEKLLKTHLNYFAGNEKLLFVIDSMENEESFYLYENNQLQRHPGFYIYYEKNEPMQNYLIDKNHNKSIEETEKVPDRAVTDFRRNILEKREKATGEERKTGSRKWILGACAAAAVLAVSATYLKNYQNMKNSLSNRETAEGIEEYITVMDSQVEGEKEITATPTVTPAITETPQPTPETESLQTTPQPSPESEEETSVTVQYEKYLIQRGDTLTSICKKRYGTIEKIEEICELNGINPEDLIFAGDTLLLPN